MTRSPRLLWLVVLAVSAVAVPASARPTKVALTQIEGDNTGLGKVVAGALDDSELEVVSGKRVARAIDRLGLDGALGDRELGKLAAELEVDAVVKGTFDRRGHKLWFTIFTNGKKGKPFPVAATNPSTDRFRKLVRTTMMAKVASVVPAQADDDDDDRSAKGRARARAKTEEVADDKPARGKKAKATADEVADDDRAARRKTRTRQRSGDEVAEATTTAAQDDEAGDDRPATGKAKLRAKAKAKAGEEVAAEDKPARAKAKAKAGEEVAAEDKPARAKAKAGEEVAAEDKPAKGKAKAGDEVAAEDKPAKGKAKAGDEVAAEDKPARPKAGDAAADTGAPRTAARRVATRDDGDVAPSAEARFEPSSPGATSSANRPAMRVDLGASMSARSLKFQSRTFDGAPGSYTNNPVPGGRVEAEVYPYALLDPSSFLAGFGVAADYDQVVSLTLRASQEMTIPLKTTERRYSFGVRYRLALGRSPTSPTLTAGVGYAARTFAVDRSGLMSAGSLDLPDVDYRMFDPGLAFRMPVGERFAVTVAGRALLLTSAGAIQGQDQYGTTKIIAGTASVGAEFAVTRRIAVRIAAEAAQFNLKFAGNGLLAKVRDGDSSTVDVRGATDRYYGGVATVAVTY